MQVITRYLEGRNKPIYHPFTDCGDHVVVINSKDVSLLGREWQYRVYFHHTGYPSAFKVSSLIDLGSDVFLESCGHIKSESSG